MLGLVGFSHSGQVLSSFWDIQASGMLTSAAGAVKTTAEQQAASMITELLTGQS
jgi:hypothetical protein